MAQCAVRLVKTLLLSGRNRPLLHDSALPIAFAKLPASWPRQPMPTAILRFTESRVSNETTGGRLVDDQRTFSLAVGHNRFIFFNDRSSV